jgi:hypothetical protein
VSRHFDLLFAGAVDGRVYGSSDDAALRQQAEHFHVLNNGKGDAGGACQGEYHLLCHVIRQSLEDQSEASSGNALMQDGGSSNVPE